MDYVAVIAACFAAIGWDDLNFCGLPINHLDTNICKNGAQVTRAAGWMPVTALSCHFFVKVHDVTAALAQLTCCYGMLLVFVLLLYVNVLDRHALTGMQK